MVNNTSNSIEVKKKSYIEGRLEGRFLRSYFDISGNILMSLGVKTWALSKFFESSQNVKVYYSGQINMVSGYHT